MTMTKSTNEAVFLIGLPGCGKTTLVHKYYSGKAGYVRLSSDVYIENKAVELGKSYNEIFNDYIKEAQKLYNELFDECMRERKSVVIDRTNLSINSRRKTLARIPDDYKKIAVLIDTPFKSIMRINDQRESFGRSIPKDVILDMLERAEAPTFAEGFDEIITVRRKL